MKKGKRWSEHDCYGNVIYLTEERWQYITHNSNHPEMEDYEDYLKITIKNGKRKQEPLNPKKYRYYHYFENLDCDVNHIVAIVLFGFSIDEKGNTIPSNYIATAFFKHMLKR